MIAKSECAASVWSNFSRCRFLYRGRCPLVMFTHDGRFLQRQMYATGTNSFHDDERILFIVFHRTHHISAIIVDYDRSDSCIRFCELCGIIDFLIYQKCADDISLFHHVNADRCRAIVQAKFLYPR